VFVGRASRTWEGVLELAEIQLVSRAYTWTVLIPVVAIVTVACAVALDFADVSQPVAVSPVLLLAAYAALALFMWRRNVRKAQQLLARRLGLNERAARRIDFRGVANFYRSVEEARAARVAK